MHTIKLSVRRLLDCAGLRMAAGCLLVVSAAQAQIPGYPANVDAADPREVAVLPRYCAFAQVFRDRVPGGNNKAEIDRWYATLGPGFHSMHHYCWGMMKSNRGVMLARTPAERQSYLSSANSEFEYVLNNTPADFVLLPEILTKKGENLLRLDMVQQGIADLQRATEAKADYWPPYAALSDFYKKTKNIAKAREWVEKGLQASPDAKGLQQRLADLGGGSPPQRRAPQPGKAPAAAEDSTATTTPQ